MGSINSVPKYLSYYNVSENEQAGTGIVFAIFQVGQMTGAFFVWLADWKGRKLPIFLGCLGVIVGTIVTATAKSSEFSLSPSLSPKNTDHHQCPSSSAAGSCSLSFVHGQPPLHPCTWWRSHHHCTAAPCQVCTTLYGTWARLLRHSVGILAPLGIASRKHTDIELAVYGTHIHFTSNLSWRLPLWLQMLCPGIVCMTVWLIPESPRFLVANDRVDEARQFIIKYHANGDPSHPIINFELNEIQANLRDVPLISWSNFFDIRILVKSRSRRYRSMLNFAWSWFGQFSGNK